MRCRKPNGTVSDGNAHQKELATELATARRSVAHETHVLSTTSVFISETQGDFWKNFNKAIAQVENFANSAEDRLLNASREMHMFIKRKFDNDQDLLTKHAARMRTAGANVRFLKDGCIPALKIDRDNPKFRHLALESFAYIRAEIEATENLIL